MTNQSFRVLLPALLLSGLSAVSWASPGSVAGNYAEQDKFSPRSLPRLIASLKSLPDIEIIQLSLDRKPNASMSPFLLAANQVGGPVRLAAAGSAGSIAVIYPDIGEPYRSIFTKIIEGIEAKTKTKVASYAIGNSFNPQELSSDLKKQDVRVVIALGRNGLKAAGTLDRDIGVVAGGVVSIPESEAHATPVHSLAPDPGLLFARLKALSPNTRRVFVTYEPRQNGWLIRLARDAARASGIELVAQEASDLKSAVLLYQEFFASADGKRDAVWLPQDSTTVDESVVLPMVLQESWARNLPVFSSSVAHVKRGVLFALYPNNLELGRNLAASALGLASGSPPTRGLTPLRDVLTAFNIRTASHLGLQISAAQQQSFDLIFPEY